MRHDNAYMHPRDIEPNVELVGLHDAGLDRVLNALDRPSVGRSASAREYAERYAAKLRQPSIAPKPMGDDVEMSRPDRFEQE